MSLDPNQVADAVAEALGESSDRAHQVLRDVFREYAATPPNDWDDLKRILDSASIVEYGQVDPLHDKLQNLADQNGNADHPRGIFEDPGLWNYYAPAAQDPDTGQAAGVPVVEGSAIYRVGEDHYLGEDHQVQVWPAPSEDGSVFYHDGTNRYNEFGQPLGTPDALSSDAGQPQHEDYEAWNGFLAEHGPRWDGTEESWQPFRDWFLYYADQNQVGESAQGFIAYAESGDKREVFTSYGITLPAAGPGTAASQAGRADETRPRAAASVPMSDEMRTHIDAVLADRPHLAKILTDEHIQAVIEELSGELSN